MFKSTLLVALCAFVFVACSPIDQKDNLALKENIRITRQAALPGDFANIPIKAGLDMFSTATDLGQKFMSGMGGRGNGGSMPQMPQGMPMSGK